MVHFIVTGDEPAALIDYHIIARCLLLRSSSPAVSLLTSSAGERRHRRPVRARLRGRGSGRAAGRSRRRRSTRAVARALLGKEFQAKPYELFILPVTAGWRAGRAALIGCGRLEDAWLERMRRVASAGALAARQRRLPRTAFLNRGLDDAADSAQAIAEGLVLASYSGDRLQERRAQRTAGRTGGRGRPAGGDTAVLERAVERGRILAESCNIARDLCNEPSNVLTPSVLADRAAAIGRERRAQRQMLDEDEHRAPPHGPAAGRRARQRGTAAHDCAAPRSALVRPPPPSSVSSVRA